MTYRVRKQAWTGKLILQERGLGPWRDVDICDAEMFNEYIASRESRIAKYERRAAGQKNAAAARKAAAQLPQQEQT